VKMKKTSEQIKQRETVQSIIHLLTPYSRETYIGLLWRTCIELKEYNLANRIVDLESAEARRKRGDLT
jgi:hypothetical protein